MTRLIEVVIAPDGQTSITTQGFVGDSCRDASRSIEQALGRQVGERLTAEFYQGHLARQIEQREG
jgi:hypothetical protein